MRTGLVVAGLLAAFASAGMGVEHPILGKQILGRTRPATRSGGRS
jgi:hypothetical protein